MATSVNLCTANGANAEVREEGKVRVVKGGGEREGGGERKGIKQEDGEVH